MTVRILFKLMNSIRRIGSQATLLTKDIYALADHLRMLGPHKAGCPDMVLCPPNLINLIWFWLFNSVVIWITFVPAAIPPQASIVLPWGSFGFSLLPSHFCLSSSLCRFAYTHDPVGSSSPVTALPVQKPFYFDYYASWIELNLY